MRALGCILVLMALPQAPAAPDVNKLRTLPRLRQTSPRSVGTRHPLRVRVASSASASSALTLSYLENMLAGGLSRAVSNGMCHSLNVCKTLLQAGDGGVSTVPQLIKAICAQPGALVRGLPSQALMSIPTGAIHFATLELAKRALMREGVPAALRRSRLAVSMLSCTCGTILRCAERSRAHCQSVLPTPGCHIQYTSLFCATSGFSFFRYALFSLSLSFPATCSSAVSVPQTVLVDRVMVGIYPSIATGAARLFEEEGLRGFYRGWAPAMGSKVEHRKAQKREHEHSSAGTPENFC